MLLSCIVCPPVVSTTSSFFCPYDHLSTYFGVFVYLHENKDGGRGIFHSEQMPSHDTTVGLPP